jgi:hypothetical protein
MSIIGWYFRMNIPQSNRNLYRGSPPPAGIQSMNTDMAGQLSIIDPVLASELIARDANEPPIRNLMRGLGVIQTPSKLGRHANDWHLAM